MCVCVCGGGGEVRGGGARAPARGRALARRGVMLSHEHGVTPVVVGRARCGASMLAAWSSLQPQHVECLTLFGTMMDCAVVYQPTHTMHVTHNMRIPMGTSRCNAPGVQSWRLFHTAQVCPCYFNCVVERRIAAISCARSYSRYQLHNASVMMWMCHAHAPLWKDLMGVSA